MRAVAILGVLLLAAAVALLCGVSYDAGKPPDLFHHHGEPGTISADAFAGGQGDIERAEEYAKGAPRVGDRVELAPVSTVPKWSVLERSDMDAIPGVVHRPHQARIEGLLRSGTFNPRDIVLVTEDGRRIAGILAGYRQQTRLLADAVAATEAHEFEELHAAGETTTIDLEGRDVQERLSALGEDPVFRVRQASHLAIAVSRSRMTATHAAEARLQEVGRAMGRELAVAFHSAGALTDAELEGVEAAITRGRSLRLPQVPAGLR